MSQVLIFFIRIYQFVLSPVLHTAFGPTSGCRYQTSCSEFMINVIRRFGPMRGLGLGTKRVLTCY